MHNRTILNFFCIPLISFFIILGGIVVDCSAQETKQQEEFFNITQMWTDLKEHIKNDSSMKISVDNIVLKNIPLGSNQDALLQGLTENNFAVKDFTHNKSYAHYGEYEASFAVYKSMWLFPYHFFGHNFGMFLDFKNGKLVHVSATAVNASPLP